MEKPKHMTVKLKDGTEVHLDGRDFPIPKQRCLKLIASFENAQRRSRKHLEKAIEIAQLERDRFGAARMMPEARLTQRDINHFTEALNRWK